MTKLKTLRSDVTGQVLGYVVLDVYDRPLDVELRRHSSSPTVFPTKAEAGRAALTLGSAVHYGTADGPACGARFHHDGITPIGETWRVTCERCKRSAAYRELAS